MHTFYNKTLFLCCTLSFFSCFFYEDSKEMCNNNQKPGLKKLPYSKQTKIPISNNENFIIHTNSFNDLVLLEGFEIDEHNNYYFFSGQIGKSILCSYSNQKLIYKKLYSEIYPSQLHLYKDTLFVFD